VIAKGTRMPGSHAYCDGQFCGVMNASSACAHATAPLVATSTKAAARIADLRVMATQSQGLNTIFGTDNATIVNAKARLMRMPSHAINQLRSTGEPPSS